MSQDNYGRSPIEREDHRAHNRAVSKQLSRLTDEAPPVLMAVVAKGADGFGVAVLHAGEAVAFLTPKQARSEARRLRQLATLAENPGECPPFPKVAAA